MEKSLSTEPPVQVTNKHKTLVDVCFSIAACIGYTQGVFTISDLILFFCLVIILNFVSIYIEIDATRIGKIKQLIRECK